VNGLPNRDQKEPDDEGVPHHLIDTEGGCAHHAEVIALNTLKEIILSAKLKVEEENGPIRIPAELMDQLLIKCERALLNYGEVEAEDVVIKELRAYLVRTRTHKDKEDERKVRSRLPEDSLRE
jgi:hypothetical protein